MKALEQNKQFLEVVLMKYRFDFFENSNDPEPRPPETPDPGDGEPFTEGDETNS
jgi:hypothetical protein